MRHSHDTDGDGPAPPPSETARATASEASVRRAVESSTDCIKVLSLDGSLEYMNEGGMCVMEIEDFGAFRGACWPDFWQGEEHSKALTALDQARAGGVGRFQGFAATAKGNVRYWDVTVSPVPGPDGSAERLLSVSRDVTAQRQAEMERDRLLDALHEERRKLWSLFEQAPAAAAVLEGEGLVFGFASRRAVLERAALRVEIAKLLLALGRKDEARLWLLEAIREAGDSSATVTQAQALLKTP